MPGLSGQLGSRSLSDEYERDSFRLGDCGDDRIIIFCLHLSIVRDIFRCYVPDYALWLRRLRAAMHRPRWRSAIRLRRGFYFRDGTPAAGGISHIC